MLYTRQSVGLYDNAMNDAIGRTINEIGMAMDLERKLRFMLLRPVWLYQDSSRHCDHRIPQDSI